MLIAGRILNASCEEVITELQRQLTINHIPYLQKTINGSRNIQVQCPYHGNGQERRPSAGIRKEDGLFHCFACGQSHTLPEVISYCFGKDDMFGKWGMRWLIKNFDAVEIEERKDVEIDMDRNNITDKDNVLGNSNADKHSTFVSEDELDKYRYYHKYWTSRGITDDAIIELFDLGYDIETDCITFPVRDEYGMCVFVARRSVKTKWFNYPKDVEKPLYGLYELYEHINSKGYMSITDFNVDKLYITESMIDCILLWQSGKYAVALNGLGSDKQISTLTRLPIRHYVLATDNDEAGERARAKLRKALQDTKLISEIVFPNRKIKDIGDCTKEQIDNIERWEMF